MKEYTVSSNEEGRRLDRYILCILKNAPSSFAYKMLRKKNITLNDHKAKGSEILRCGDTVKFYLSDETFDGFSKKPEKPLIDEGLMPEVIYEDDDIVIVDKPAGMLTQRASADDVSLNEILLSYVTKDNPDDGSFTPSVCNRLDRNTSGLVSFAKTYKGARYLTDAFKKRTVEKYYTCVVKGVVKHDQKLTGKIIKDHASNMVTLTDAPDSGSDVVTVIHPLKNNGSITLLSAKLITGKTHQIRAHLAAIGHPLIGDVKYGDKKINEIYRRDFGIKHQMLKCTKMVFPNDGILAVSGMTIELKIPESFDKVM